MQEIRTSNLLVVTEICDPNKPQARHNPSLKLGVEKLRIKNPTLNKVTKKKKV